jgi:hypothetical protein
MRDFNDAMSQIERLSGGQLPVEYRQWLSMYQPMSTNSEHRPFDLNQLLEVQRLVQDVIPPGTVAIGDDGYGNLVLLRFADGSIEFWDHERELNDFATETICPSFAAYLEFLTISPVLDSQ